MGNYESFGEHQDPRGEEFWLALHGDMKPRSLAEAQLADFQRHLATDEQIAAAQVGPGILITRTSDGTTIEEVRRGES